MNNFLEKMAEILEVDVSEISAETKFREMEDWDSLKGFSILVMLESDYQHKVSIIDFQKFQTLGDIYAGIQAK